MGKVESGKFLAGEGNGKIPPIKKTTRDKDGNLVYVEFDTDHDKTKKVSDTLYESHLEPKPKLVI